ncbi:pentapeptide repeat-containing protein [Kamptonema formosum]|uniref:pentapeptide repeat-containing protein n=1 Tax=Kamptonema formosum TaxID=331992 RepID=UPI0009E38B16
MSNTVLESISLREANLTGANLEGVEFRKVSFQNTIMPDGSIRNGKGWYGGYPQ